MMCGSYNDAISTAVVGSVAIHKINVPISHMSHFCSLAVYILYMYIIFPDPGGFYVVE